MRLLFQVLSSAASYVLWFISAALGIVDILIARGLLLETANTLSVNPWTQGAIDKFGLLVLGVGWLVLTYAAEAYYRKAAAENMRKLLRYFILVTGTQIAFGGLAWLATILLI